MTALALTSRGVIKAENWRDLLSSRYVEMHDPIYPSERHFLAHMDWRRVKPHVEDVNLELSRVQDPGTREHRRAVFNCLAASAKTADAISHTEEEEMATKKAATKKAPVAKKAAKPKAEGESRGRRSNIDGTSVITVKAEKNPKRAGSKGFAAFALYRDGMTVKQFRDKGGRAMDLAYDVKHGYISLAAA